MNQNQTEAKPQDVEEPSPDGLDQTPCCASWIQGAPPTTGGSYVILWDNGAESVAWAWTGANAAFAVGHIPIPPKPPLDYNPRAYGNCDDRGWVGQYSWHNAKGQPHLPTQTG